MEKIASIELLRIGYFLLLMIPAISWVIYSKFSKWSFIRISSIAVICGILFGVIFFSFSTGGLANGGFGYAGFVWILGYIVLLLKFSGKIRLRNSITLIVLSVLFIIFTALSYIYIDTLTFIELHLWIVPIFFVLSCVLVLTSILFLHKDIGIRHLYLSLFLILFANNLWGTELTPILFWTGYQSDVVNFLVFYVAYFINIPFFYKLIDWRKLFVYFFFFAIISFTINVEVISPNPDIAFQIFTVIERIFILLVVYGSLRKANKPDKLQATVEVSHLSGVIMRP